MQMKDRRCLFLLAFGFMAALSPISANAARLIKVRIYTTDSDTEQKEILRGHTGDNGKADADTVWTYLGRIRFGPKQCRNGFKIVPDEDNPDRVTIHGEIRIDVSYSGFAEIEAPSFSKGREGPL
jgi:hypothetical protein